VPSIVDNNDIGFNRTTDMYAGEMGSHSRPTTQPSAVSGQLVAFKLATIKLIGCMALLGGTCTKRMSIWQKEAEARTKLYLLP